MVTKEVILQNTIERCREQKIVLPTYQQMKNPETIPGKIKAQLSKIGLWDVNSMNLFRITWKNEPVSHGGAFGDVNFIEIPKQLSGVDARIIILIGKYFPTGAHKVGATFGPLVEKLISGRFDPTRQKALWPSTGNYCRGGAYDSKLLGCQSIAVLPEGMSRERFDYLEKLEAEIFATPGTESNVKEIYDKVKELKAERGDEIVVLNQFEEIGNSLWHYEVTGSAMNEVYEQIKKPGSKLSGLFLTQGSAGTLGSADKLRELHPFIKVGAGEALQCPTLLENGFGEHRIEGIGDKHVPWIHNIKNMDVVAGIDDVSNIKIMRLFNEKEGKQFLSKEAGLSDNLVNQLSLFGISSIANIMGAIKMAKYFEMTDNDVLFTVATDSMDMYQTRIQEEREQYGALTNKDAAVIYAADLMGIKTDHLLEMNYREKKRMHNLKYFTWIEQQGKTVEELNAQWYDDTYWSSRYAMVDEWDEQIKAFNDRTGVLDAL